MLLFARALTRTCKWLGILCEFTRAVQHSNRADALKRTAHRNVRTDMATATEFLEKCLSQGSSLEVALADLRQAGTSPIEAIKAIRSVLKVDLGEAKRIFSGSSAWHSENEAADLLHTQILTVLQND